MALRRASSARDDFLRLPLIRAEEKTLREGAYDDRRSREIRTARFLVAELMREVPGEGMVESTVLNRIRNLSRPLDRPDSEGWHLPKGRDEEWFLDHLVHRGGPAAERGGAAFLSDTEFPGPPDGQGQAGSGAPATEGGRARTDPNGTREGHRNYVTVQCFLPV